MIDNKKQKTEPIVLAEGTLRGRVGSSEVLRILEQSRSRYNLSDNSLLNVVFVPLIGDNYRYMVYVNTPDAPLPLSYNEKKGLISVIGGKVLLPAIPQTGRQQFDALLAPASGYKEGGK